MAIQLVNLRRRPSGDLRQNKPRDNDGNRSGSGEAVLIISIFRLYCDHSNNEPGDIQETSPNPPLRGFTVDHLRGTEAKHDSDHIRQRQRESCCLGAQPLRRNLRCVGIPDCGRTGCRKGGKTSEENLHGASVLIYVKDAGKGDQGRNIQAKSSTSSWYNQSIPLSPALGQKEP